ncbi:MAG: tRNA (cytosine(32)/uridine(32)-2'-O)-methyltransferase TrmJ [Gammaproteobacteria bacterium]|nr:tRNA (cytosine(32)/uridine(32)-2'-O)-methyltransferase TrmJ [Gammaproteobacteria bacterium]NNF61646.1 tRNA (cytosine(32)/uridine(32)-2'-O)-methyltransferase TrmJ [Gammaproteobacteria bacterium]NNM20548.1 tRNA (cytosine(32)/uridine(32)-2'-O)-methyltransferase TrmJ [Gammaproteobacteria bacterium]
MAKVLDNIRVVLVETSHPGNIGATARAMKTMGLQHLRLVNPKYFPHADATAMASGADDLLGRAEVFERLTDAVADCVAVVGASARLRTHHWPTVDARDSAQKLLAASAGEPLAVVFGRERSGLSNEELDHCQWLLNIPANPDYASLNLAMAVQIVSYELRMAQLGEGPVDATAAEPAPAGELERLFEHLEQVMVQTDFLNPDNPRYLMRRLRLLFNRATPDQNEVNILRGLLTSVQRLKSMPDKPQD